MCDILLHLGQRIIDVLAASWMSEHARASEGEFWEVCSSRSTECTACSLPLQNKLPDISTESN
jgi:hypothetical protein